MGQRGVGEAQAGPPDGGGRAAGLCPSVPLALGKGKTAVTARLKKRCRHRERLERGRKQRKTQNFEQLHIFLSAEPKMASS